MAVSFLQQLGYDAQDNTIWDATSDRVIVSAGLPVESYGVSYRNDAGTNVRAFNRALARRGLVTLTTPGQYLIGGPGQGGLLIPSNTSLLVANGVELIVADQTLQPLIRTALAYETGVTITSAIVYGSLGYGISGTVNQTNIGLIYPAGTWIAVAGFDLSLSNSQGWTGVYKVWSSTPDQIVFMLTQFIPSGSNSPTGAIIRPADTNIRIIGGLWNGNDTGNVAYSDGDPRQFVIGVRNAQDVIVSDVEFKRGVSWSLGPNMVRDCTFRNLSGDLYLDGLGTANAIIQGAGRAHNVLIENVTGACEDNMVAWTLDSMVGGTVSYPNYDQGDVTGLKIKNVNAQSNNSAVVALWGNTNSRFQYVEVDGIYGRCAQSAFQILTYAPTNMLNCRGGTLKIKNISGTWNSIPVLIRSDGDWDSLQIDGVINNNIPGGGLPLVKLYRSITTQSFKQVNIAHCEQVVTGFTLNRNGPAVEIEDTNIEDLHIHDFPTMRLQANISLVKFTGTAGTIARAVVERLSGVSNAAGDSFVVSCENINATALGRLCIRDSTMVGNTATGGVGRQAPAGRVTTVLIDNSSQTAGEGIWVSDNGVNPAAATVRTP